MTIDSTRTFTASADSHPSAELSDFANTVSERAMLERAWAEATGAGAPALPLAAMLAAVAEPDPLGAAWIAMTTEGFCV